MSADREQELAIGEAVADALERLGAQIAADIHRIADALDDVTDRGRLNVGGLVITREDRP